ncbi:unnamed protein product [Miscanthus lutarioriparius]|uniref:C2 domain-containing protein n=1 Tax=Miscanthus lutarioriparius TaxID=422564 RepID=A0A811QUI5_9POAL|nr:unnamed protein product [Miscanthus lutarioriparius]
MKLVVEISDAADLAPKDGAASCNPYVEVDFDDQRQRTATKPADRSPYWNQTLVFDVRDPARFPSLPVDVSVFHDRRLQDHNALRPHTFLGRVRINGASVAPSPEEAVLQRYPLEKRGLFSRVSGDIALRIYLVGDVNETVPVSAAPNQQQESVAAAAASGDPERIVRSAFAPQQPPPVEQSEAQGQGKSGGGPAGDEHEARPPRIFRSVPASGGGGGGGGADQQPRRTLHAVAAPPPPPGQTVVMPKPTAAAPPGPAFGLVETKPPLPAKMGPRAAAAAAAKIASTYDMVEPMAYLYVSVVKARDLPNMDVTGALDPYVEVKLGNFKGVTKHLDKNPNPDDFVGRVLFDMTDIPKRLPPDSPLAPQWYRLADRHGEKVRHGEIMLAVWIGTQADEAFPEAWHSDAHSLPFEGLSNTRSKVYYSPKLAYLKVVAIAAQDVYPAGSEKGRPLAPTIAKIQLGWQVRRTRPGQPQGSTNPVWNEEFMFVAGEPFDEPLVVTVEERVAAGRDEPVGRVIIPVISPYVYRNDLAKSVESKWFNLSRALTADEAAAGVTAAKALAEKTTFSSKIHLRLSLETAYHVLDESTHYSSDLQPSAKKLRKSSIGILELGILSARNLVPMKAKEGRLTDPYCVAKYGSKWVRTRTVLNTLAPQWNEQYTWEVFDPCTIVTVAVFDNGYVRGGGEGSKDQRIGKVRVRLSTLEIDRVYTHIYPLMTLTPGGLKKTGELHLAVRFTCTAWANMLGMYAKPLLPKMHYSHPISVLQLDYLRFQAMQMVAARLGRAEPPLRREVVEYMLDVDSHMFSLRRSKANFNRITPPLLGRRGRGQVDGRHLQVEEPADDHPGARAVPHPGVLPGADPAHSLSLPLHDRRVELPAAAAQAAAHGHGAIARRVRAGAPGRAGRGVRHVPHQQARGRGADALRPPAQRGRAGADGGRRPGLAGGAGAGAAQLEGPEGDGHLHHALARGGRGALRDAVPGGGRGAGALPAAPPALPEQAAVGALQLLQEAAGQVRHAALASPCVTGTGIGIGIGSLAGCSSISKTANKHVF